MATVVVVVVVVVGSGGGLTRPVAQCGGRLVANLAVGLSLRVWFLSLRGWPPGREQPSDGQAASQRERNQPRGEEGTNRQVGHQTLGGGPAPPEDLPGEPGRKFKKKIKKSRVSAKNVFSFEAFAFFVSSRAFF